MNDSHHPRCIADRTVEIPEVIWDLIRDAPDYIKCEGPLPSPMAIVKKLEERNNKYWQIKQGKIHITQISASLGHQGFMLISVLLRLFNMGYNKTTLEYIKLFALTPA